MDPARWERVQALFHRAADLDKPARARLLADECDGDAAMAAEVQRMLDEDSRASLLDCEVAGMANDLLGGALSSSFRDSSPYRIQRVLGEGGMGVVYLAQRTDLGNLVAIKILRDSWRSPERRARFAAEQRMLAQLNHPSIARLYDANTLPDGTPWFVMEYVDGVPLTEYCRREQSTVEQRLRLIRTVAEAVQYAHERGVVHRDLKPSNILVKSDGSLRLLDFGIAKQLDSDAVSLTKTQLRPMTPAYASPEQLRGDGVGILTDVYSLGIVLYELLTGKLPFDVANKTPSEVEALISTTEPPHPSAVARRAGSPGGNADLDALCLVAMDKDPKHRYPSAAAFVRDIDRYLSHEPLEARRGFRRSSLASLARRHSRAAAAVMATLIVIFVAVAITLAVSRRSAYAPAHSRTVAVIPFLNIGADHDLDYLRQPLADEIWRTLSGAPSLSLRPAEAGRRYAGGASEAQRAGKELHAGAVASGRFLKAGDQLQITMELTDVDSNRLIWSDVFDVPAGNMVAMQAQVAAKTRRAMAPVLGAAEFVSAHPPVPRNEEAYKLYLQATALPDELSTDPETFRRIIDMLRRSVALDPSYAPAWERLSSHSARQAWWGKGGDEAKDLARRAMERAIALDPDNVIWQAGWLYQSTAPGYASEAGARTKGEAYRGIAALLHRRPDVARLHFLISWLLRDAGMLDEAASECEASVLIDAQDAGARSCGVVYLFRGDYAHARDYLNLDPDSEVSRAMNIDIFLRQSKPQEALRAMHAFLPKWAGYDVLQAYLEHRSGPEIAGMTRALQPAGDPEMNYFSAVHLAYVGQRDAALDMLQHAVDGGYCSFPAAKTDPMLSTVVTEPRFAAIEAAGTACRDRFLKERTVVPAKTPSPF
jgi:serine/threonine protein kinase/TolB-like protein